MKHLSPAEFVDLLDGRLDGARARHAAECRECREQSDIVRSAMVEAADVRAPEPSPLFWTHFRARVSAAVGDERLTPRPGAWPVWWVRRAISVPLAVAVVALVALAAISSRPGVTPQDPPEIAASAPDVFWTTDDDDSDEAWALVRAASEGIGWDEAVEAGLALAPEATARAADELTDAERAELARLLEEEIKRTGA